MASRVFRGQQGFFGFFFHSRLSRVFRKNLAQHGQQGFFGFFLHSRLSRVFRNKIAQQGK
jgi:hypothetical protein